MDRLPGLGVVLSPEFRAALEPRPREKIVTGGWQAGKSYLGAADLLLPVIEDLVRQALGAEKPGPRLYWGIVPSYKAPCKEFDYLSEWGKALGILTRTHFPENDSRRIEFYGGWFRYETKTAQDIAAIAGEPLDGAVDIEAGQQADAVYDQLQGRVITKRGWLDFTGTIEPTEAAPRWAWFEKKAKEWQDGGNPEQRAFSLPSWANLSVFPGGRDDPEMQRLEQMYGAESVQFRRRFAGEPVGVSYPIYWELENDRVAADGIHPRGFYDTHPVWMNGMNAGGHDFGTGGAYNHPSTLVACTVLNRGLEGQNIVVVREAWSSLTLDQNEIEYHRRRLSQKYTINRTRWGFDPLQKEAAQMADAQTTGGPGSRPAKVGMIEARLNRGTLLFDFEGPGVQDLYDQMRRVHWIKRLIVGRGEVFDYNRDDDDLVAALEDAIAVIDGHTRFAFPTGKLGGMAVKRAVAKIPRRLF